MDNLNIDYVSLLAFATDKEVEEWKSGIKSEENVITKNSSNDRKQIIS